MIRVGIVDYGVGNLGSVQNAFDFIQNKNEVGDFEVRIESKPENLKDYDKLLLPGVGAFGNAMEHLRNIGMDRAVIEFAKSGKYLLGICLGMQLLFEKSFEFGEHKGLSLMQGEVVGFEGIAPLKIPHIGWNSIHFTQRAQGLEIFKGVDDKSFLYFVHSFHIQAKEELILAYCEYGYPFGAIVNKDNLFGIQAHPEKSHDVGLRLLTNFMKLK